MLPILARAWPGPMDTVAIVLFALVVIVFPTIGYVVLYHDVRRYLRSLRRVLVKVFDFVPNLPNWAQRDTPRCIAVFGLSMPCSLEQLHDAYRQRVKQMHPDLGGDPKQFLQLQRQYKQAQYVISQKSVEDVPVG